MRIIDSSFLDFPIFILRQIEIWNGKHLFPYGMYEKEHRMLSDATVVVIINEVACATIYGLKGIFQVQKQIILKHSYLA